MEPAGRSRIAALALGIAALTVAVYAPVLDNDFVAYDDDLYIQNSAHVKQGLSAETVAWAFTSFRGANWFPLTRLSWATDVSLFGLDPRAFHATSLLFHVANAVLLFLAFRRLSGTLWPSAAVALVFAVHPLHVESVAWAAARKDVVSGFFAMLALFAYAGVDGGRRPAALAAVFACLALGLMAKPTLVTWPFVLLLLDAWPLGRLQRADDPGRIDAARLRAAVVEKLPLFALVVAASALAVASQSHWGTVQDLSRLAFPERVANALVSYAAYLRDAFWPASLAVFYPHPGGSLGVPQVAGAAALLVAVSAVAVALRRRLPELAVGWLWFLGVLVPVIGFVQVGQAARADRYTYLPLIGLSLPVVWGAAALAARGRTARAAVAVAAVVALAALCVTTRAQVRTWRDSETLFRHALAVTRNNHVAHINLGVDAYNRGDDEVAARELERALEIAPSSALAAGVLGDVRVDQGRPEEGMRLYRRAQEREPDSPRWREGVANAQLDLGHFEEAVALYRGLLDTRGDRYQLHANLGLALARLGRHDEAIEAYQRALSLRSDLAEVHGNLGVSLVAVGREDEAITHFARALSLDPGLALVRAHYGNLLAGRGQLEEALAHLREAVQLEPRNGKFHAALGLALFDAKQLPEAEAHQRRALELGYRSLMGASVLAQIALAQDRPDEAVAFAEEAVDLSHRRVTQILALLGDAYALAGRFDDATRVTEEALTVARARGQAAMATLCAERLAAYRDGRRY